jgi:hypothetical protein
MDIGPIGSTSREQFLRKYHREVSRALQFAAAYAGTASFIPTLGAKYTIHIQKVTVNITTDAAQTLTVQEGGGRVFCTVPASPGVGIMEFDFGAEGMASTKGAEIDIVLSGAGLAGWINIEAYALIEPEAGIVPSDL